jgi:hypothetical protein
MQIVLGVILPVHMNVISLGATLTPQFFTFIVSNNLGTVETYEVEVQLHTIGIIVTLVAKNRIHYYYYLHCCRLMQNHSNYMW